MKKLTWTLIVHGTGNAWPEICGPASDCPLCSGADRPYPSRGNTSVSLVLGSLTNPEFHILIDAGAGCHAALRRAGLRAPDVLLFTHSHPDHLNHMELDTVLRLLKGGGRDRLTVVATPTTFSAISEFHRRRLDHVSIEPGGVTRLTLPHSFVKIEAIDAADHWPGAVNFIVSENTFRFGALFDQKTWKPEVIPLLENLCLAVIEANQLWPMAARTGHVSLAESLHLLRSLRRPPRMSLLTHMGHDDEVQFSMGTLASQLHALTPGLAVSWAYPGMTIDTASLPPRNPVAVLDRETNLVVGVEEKAAVHALGLLHASVLLLVRTASGRIAVYRRHAKQSYPGCLDVFGGHYQPEDVPDPMNTAFRELTEELRIFLDGQQIRALRSWLRSLSGAFELESTSDANRERSTLFGVSLPPNVSLIAACQRSPETA